MHANERGDELGDDPNCCNVAEKRVEKSQHFADEFGGEAGVIDFVSLQADFCVPDSAFEEKYWKFRVLASGTPVIYHFRMGVVIRYYPLTGRWKITGKLICLLYDTQVSNVDDVYGKDLDGFVADMNAYLQSMLRVPMPDIRTFKALRIDYCFNILTPYVKEYLDFMTEAFRMTNRGTRINFTQEHHLRGSLYVKTKNDYQNNARRNYVLNYYDKHDRLRYQCRQGQAIRRSDWERAQNVLRLEIQCGYAFVQQLCNKLSCSRSFGELLSFQAAYLAHEIVYHRVLHGDVSLDYYTYAMAKRRLSNGTALRVLERSAEHHPVLDEKCKQGRKIIEKEGVYPHWFLPKNGGVEVLLNPLKLIRMKCMASIGRNAGEQAECQ